MISIHTDKKLNIILPNTNKALAKVLKDASPEELEVVTKGKDLKSIIGSLLKESSSKSTSDKTLLELVKNNPTLKNLGSANQDIKELINTIKSDKSLLHVEKLLQKFLPDIKEVKNLNVKTTIENSGVFLESKLKDIKAPLEKLNTILKELSQNLQKSKLPNAKLLDIATKELIQTSSSTNQTPKALEDIAKNVKNIITKLQAEFKGADPISTKDFATKLDKLQHLIQPNNLEKTNFKLPILQDALKDISITLKNSFTKESSKALESINKSIKTIELTLKDNPKIIQTSIKELQKIVQDLKINLKDQNPITTKDLASKMEILQNISKEKNIKLPVLQESMRQVISSLENTPIKDAKGFMDALSKIFKPLQALETSTTTIDKKIITEIKTTSENLQSSIKNVDPVLSKDVKVIFEKLSLLNTADKLSNTQNIKELLSNDLKAVLPKVNEEILKLNLPNQTEVLKQVDKLALQIDYYQLVSHLGDASSLYVPFSWDQMQDGDITIKKSKEDKFYCDIDLKLKDYGELNIRLTLYDKNQLNIRINSDNKEFKDIIQENIPSLRTALIDVNITPREIRLLNITKKSPTVSVYDEISRDIDIGFEVIG